MRETTYIPLIDTDHTAETGVPRSVVAGCVRGFLRRSDRIVGVETVSEMGHVSTHVFPGNWLRDSPGVLTALQPGSPLLVVYVDGNIKGIYIAQPPVDGGRET